PDRAAERPIATPATPPATTAIASPAAIRPRLGSTLPTASGVRNRCEAGPENHCWYIRSAMADGGGKNELPCRCAHICHSTTAAAITAHRAATRPGARLTPPPASTRGATAGPAAR